MDGNEPNNQENFPPAVELCYEAVLSGSNISSSLMIDPNPDTLQKLSDSALVIHRKNELLPHLNGNLLIDRFFYCFIDGQCGSQFERPVHVGFELWATHLLHLQTGQFATDPEFFADVFDGLASSHAMQTVCFKIRNKGPDPGKFTCQDLQTAMEYQRNCAVSHSGGLPNSPMPTLPPALCQLQRQITISVQDHMGSNHQRKFARSISEAEMLHNGFDDIFFTFNPNPKNAFSLLVFMNDQYFDRIQADFPSESEIANEISKNAVAYAQWFKQATTNYIKIVLCFDTKNMISYRVGGAMGLGFQDQLLNKKDLNLPPPVPHGTALLDISDGLEGKFAHDYINFAKSILCAKIPNANLRCPCGGNVKKLPIPRQAYQHVPASVKKPYATCQCEICKKTYGYQQLIDIYLKKAIAALPQVQQELYTPERVKKVLCGAIEFPKNKLGQSNYDMKYMLSGEGPGKSFYIFEYTFKEQKKLENVVMKTLAAHDSLNQIQILSNCLIKKKNLRYLLGQINAQTSQLVVPSTMMALLLKNSNHAPYWISFDHILVNYGAMLRNMNIMPSRNSNNDDDMDDQDHTVTKTSVPLTSFFKPAEDNSMFLPDDSESLNSHDTDDDQDIAMTDNITSGNLPAFVEPQDNQNLNIANTYKDHYSVYHARPECYKDLGSGEFFSKCYLKPFSKKKPPPKEKCLIPSKNSNGQIVVHPLQEKMFVAEHIHDCIVLLDGHENTWLSFQAWKQTGLNHYTKNLITNLHNYNQAKSDARNLQSSSNAHQEFLNTHADEPNATLASDSPNNFDQSGGLPEFDNDLDLVEENPNMFQEKDLDKLIKTPNDYFNTVLEDMNHVVWSQECLKTRPTLPNV
ncbi:hypothetical protein HK100_006649, partial [Physocladia obscura]